MRDPDDGLRALFNGHVPHPRDFQNVETGLTSLGVPDLNFCIEGVEGWIEMKATAHWAVTLRPNQIGWLLTRKRHGGQVFIAVRRRTEQGADELYLCRGEYAEQLKLGGLRWALKQAPDRLKSAGRGGLKVGDTPRLPLLGVWTGGPTRGWDWGAVRRLLTT